MSVRSLTDLVFILDLRQHIVECQTELTRVMNNPGHTDSERDALISAIAELKQVAIRYEPHGKRKPVRRGNYAPTREDYFA